MSQHQQDVLFREAIQEISLGTSELLRALYRDFEPVQDECDAPLRLACLQTAHALWRQAGLDSGVGVGPGPWPPSSMSFPGIVMQSQPPFPPQPPTQGPPNPGGR